jgi:peptidoglycan/xylan/chitin deacetylase (PgdA/CDA1 family)
VLVAARQAVADLVASVLWRTGISRPARRAANRLTIVMFHRVLPPDELRSYPYPGIAVTPDELDWALQLFTRHFTVDPVSTSWEALVEGRPAPKPRLSVSFDDGQWDNLVHGAPVLARRGVRATFYVPVEPVDAQRLIWHDELGYSIAHLVAHQSRDDVLVAARRHGLRVEGDGDVADDIVEAAKALRPEHRDVLVEELASLARDRGHDPPSWGRLMTWDEVRALHAEGHEVGSHSLSHTLLPQLAVDEITREIAGSKAAIERELGAPITSFCYPNGDQDATCRDLARAAGYVNAVSTAWGRNRADADPFALARCDIDVRRFRDRRGRLSEARAGLRLGGLQPGLS